MAIETYNNPYDSQINSENLAAEAKQIHEAQSLFENQDMVKIIKTYIEENIPEEVKETRLYKEFWAVLGKKVQLTFLDAEDKFEFEACFQQAKMAYLMSIPSYETDFNTIARLKQIELYFFAALRGAIGTKVNKFNERLVLGSTITQNIRSNTEQFGSTQKKGGMFGGLNRLF